MSTSKAFTILMTLMTIASASPIVVPSSSTSSLIQRASDPIQQLTYIAPNSTSCDGAPFPSECATASSALGPLLLGFSKYSITTAAEQAALLSWMAFESADFKYNINHYPGTPGQGTRCMMSPTFVKEYVASLSDLSSNATSATTPAEILDLVLDNEHSFASASWFLSTQCSASVRTALQSGSDQGWEGFITGCVQTTVTDARKAYWDRAKTALYV